jgi:hypothetical protein
MTTRVWETGSVVSKTEKSVRMVYCPGMRWNEVVICIWMVYQVLGHTVAGTLCVRHGDPCVIWEDDGGDGNR